MTTRSKLPPGIPDSTLTLATIGPVARSSVVDAVADKLRGEILAGRLAPGTRLPGKLTIEARLFPYDLNHQTFINVYEGGALARQEVLGGNRTSVDFFSGSRQGLLAVFTTFTASGVHHIAIGPDHILFIIGLLLLGGTLGRLLMIVTAFTIGHSITLALATLQIVDPPARGFPRCSRRPAASI